VKREKGETGEKIIGIFLSAFLLELSLKRAINFFLIFLIQMMNSNYRRIT
jgi:hypothetical protein